MFDRSGGSAHRAQTNKGEPMKRFGIAILCLALPAAFLCAEETPVFKSDKEKVSYGIGVSIVKNFKQQGIEVEVDMLMRGIRDGLSGAKLLMTEDELRSTMTAYQEELRQTQAKARKSAEADNKKAGDEFLAANKAKEGVVTLPSGLQYKILKAGEGKKPVETDTVQARYRGTLINGTEFDKTDPNGPPAEFKVTGVIPGWQEALKLMPVGSKWQLFIPPELAYSTMGAGALIGPNTTLIFEVELVGIK
jgi:FKBP-type peptidyl-prolyl cis-trans isomerase